MFHHLRQKDIVINEEVPSIANEDALESFIEESKTHQANIELPEENMRANTKKKLTLNPIPYGSLSDQNSSNKGSSKKVIQKKFTKSLLS